MYIIYTLLTRYLHAPVYHGTEGGEAALDHIPGDAVAEPEVARAAEAVGRHYQQIVPQLGGLGEGVGVPVGGLHQQIKGTVRFGAGIAHFRQTVIEQLPVLVIGGQIGPLPGTAANDHLHQGGRAHMAHDPGRAGNGGVQGLPILGEAGDVHIADALPRQGEGLGIGITG